MSMQSKRRGIKALQTKLKIDQDAYVQILQQLTGKTSSLKLNESELNKVLNYLNKLSGDTVSQNAKQLRTIKFLWMQLGEAKLLEDPSMDAMNAFCKRYTANKPIYRASSSAMSMIIDALKGWCRRENVSMGRLR